MKKFGDLLWGIFFIALGLIIGLNALGITNINIFFSGWWTLFIIVPCFIGLFREESKLGNLIGLIIGIILLASAQGLISMELFMKLIIPIIFVAIGLSIIFKEALTNTITEKVKSVDKNNLESYCATFSEQKVNMNGEEFKGANLEAVFGGVELDLNGAHFSEDKVIYATAIFGGVEIRVPQNVNVKVKSNSIFGGVKNMVNHKNENAPTLFVNASAVFGGVEIK